MRSLVKISILCAFAVGCSNEVTSVTPDLESNGELPPETTATEGPNAALCGIGPAQLRLLTAEEFDNTIADLFGDTRNFGTQFPGQPVVGGFENNAGALQTSELLVESLSTAAEAISARVAANLDTFLACASDADDACARTFIRDQGLRIFRRPLTDDERARYFTVFEAGKAFDFTAGIEFVVNAMIQSPSFLYRAETVSDDGRFEPYTMASRLSYFLWASSPDDALLAAAGNGELESDAGITAQAERMIADPKARRGFSAFTQQWLELDAMEFLGKNPERYPEFNTGLRSLWTEQMQRFVEHAVFDDPSDHALFRANYTFANETLAELYGLDPVSGSDMQRVPLASGMGLLAQPGLLALHAHDYPAIYRGKYILTEILCTSVPPPPDVFEVPVIEEQLPERDFVDALTMSDGCATCHQAINPMGHALGNFDGLGRYQDVDAYGFAVDSQSELLVQGESIPVDGPDDLMDTLSSRPEVAQCLTRKIYRYAFGRTEGTADACALDALANGYTGNVQDLLVAVATHESFTHGVAQ